jgi:signal transduction histidine kinase
VNSPAARITRLPQVLAAWVAALPRRRQERVQDLALALVLAVVNALSLLPFRAHLHPLWLAEILVVLQALPLIWRRSGPGPGGGAVLGSLVIGAARVAYDQIGFGSAPFPLGPAIALYTVMTLASAWWRWIVGAFVVAGVAVSLSAPGHNEPYEAITQAFIFLTAAAAGVLSRARQANLRAAESRADRAEAEMDRQSARAAARERVTIARELHDVVAHHVSLMAVQAEAAASLLPGQPAQAARSVAIIGDTARLALTELRRLLGVLRGPGDRLETAPSATLGELDGVLEQVRGAGLPVDFEVVGTPGQLAPGVDLTAYRIVQEALTNTIRHAHADRAAVTVTYEPGYITVRVADSGPRLAQDPDGPPAAETRLARASLDGTGLDGTGLDGTGLDGTGLAGAGLGLAGIAERVASCGGNLSVGPTPSGGFAVTARLPAR